MNFAQGSLDEAAAEVRAVSSILGNRLQAIEIGNEVGNYARGDKPFRKQPYDYETYRREYNDWRDAILKVRAEYAFCRARYSERRRVG